MTVPTATVGVWVVGVAVGDVGAMVGENETTSYALQDSRIGSRALIALSIALLAASLVESAVASAVFARVTLSK